MTLCDACSVLPIRDVLRESVGDEASTNRLQAWNEPRARYTDKFGAPFLKLNRTLGVLESNASDCPICDLICVGLKGSLRFHDPTKWNAQSEIWLRVSRGALYVWLGSEILPLDNVGGCVGISATKESPISQYLGRYSVIQDPLSLTVLATIESWLQSCCGESHGKCPREGQMTPLPTRLLDLSGLPERRELLNRSTQWRSMFQERACRLIEMRPESRGQYVALSYCWGSNVPFTTTSANLQEHKQENGITFDQLPETLQDAVLMVRFLGLRYLWVDCLCIVQDDIADWEHEAAQMADVYSNAFLTLAAMRASHCDEGFLGPRTPREQTLPVSFSDPEGTFMLDLRYHDYTVSPGALSGAVELAPLKLQREEPMMNRVWCYQERVLARRTIHFTSHEMYWECEVGLLEETAAALVSSIRYTEYCITDLAKGLTNRKDFGWVGTPPEFEFREHRAWYDVVLEYTSRNLTYQKDKLPALSGVIAAIAKMNGDVCYAGIWRGWFLSGLLWRVQDPDDQYAYVSKTPEKLAQWRAPSWSFAAIEGVATYDMLPEHAELCGELLECRVVPKGRNPLGELQSGFARIKAPVVSILHIGELGEDIYISGRKGKVQLRDQSERTVNVYFDVDHFGKCYALMITPTLGIAMIPAGTEEEHFVRIGIVEINRHGATYLGEGFEKLNSLDLPNPRSITLL